MATVWQGLQKWQLIRERVRFQVPKKSKAEFQQRLRDGVPVSRILMDEWLAKKDGNRNIEHCGMSRAVAYKDVKGQEEKTRHSGDCETIADQAKENWLQRIDPSGLNLQEESLRRIPAAKIRDYGQGTLIMYTQETIDLLRTHGKTIIVDATHGLVDCHFSTVFMAVYDERGTGNACVRSVAENLLTTGNRPRL